MRRILLLLTVAAVMAMMLALTAGPAFAQAGEVEGLPEGGCPSGGGWEEKVQQPPPGSEGNLTLANDTPEDCFKRIEQHPDITPLPDDAEVLITDVVR
jgi:hypothetical protein